jgi:hypothetical protein
MLVALLAGEQLTPPEPARRGPTRRIRASDKAPKLWASIDLAARLVLDADLSLDLGNSSLALDLTVPLPTLAELTAGGPLA